MEELVNVRSKNSREKAFVRFINYTQRKVEINWINFTGMHVIYDLLDKECYLDVNTYKTHPWIALDYYTRDRLHIEKQFVYFPKTSKEFFQERCPHKEPPPTFEARVRARITIPVYTLRFAALLAVRDTLKREEDADKLDVPKELIRDLKNAVNLRYKKNLVPLITID